MQFSVLSCFFPVLFADIESANATALEFQLQCILRLTQASEHADPSRYLRVTNFIRPTESIDDVCEWSGFFCAHGIVHTLEIAFLATTVDWDTDWFPPCINKLCLSFIPLQTTLDTRHLPRVLTECTLNFCSLTGHLEFRTLPRHIRSFVAEGNDFSGTIFIVFLPASLMHIDVKHNRIKKTVISLDRLPAGLHLSVLEQKQKKTTIVWEDETPVDDGIIT